MAVIVLLLFIIMVLIFSIPAVQTSLGKYVTKRINDEFKTNINVDRVSLQFNGDIELKKIYIEDYKQDTLISIMELNTSIISFRNFYKGTLTFGDIDIEDLVFNIRTYKGEQQTNLDVFVAKLESDNPKLDDNKFIISSSDVSIYNGILKISNENQENEKVLDFYNLNLNATNFLINGSDVSARINTFAVKDTRGVTIENMMSNFNYTLTDMTFNDLQIETEGSLLRGNLKFNYDREDLKYFTDKVLVDATFINSHVLLDELNPFYNEFGDHQSTNFSVHANGTLNDLKLNALKLTSGRKTRLFGDITFRNLFSKESGNFYMDGKFDYISSTYYDLKALLPNILGKSIPSITERLGYFNISGTSKISSNTANANLNIETELGHIVSNLDILKINNMANASYKGSLILKQFDIGTFIEEPTIGDVSLNLKVQGKGFLAENLNAHVNGVISDVVYNDYNYKNTKVAGTVKNKIFDGSIITEDENLRFNFNGLADFSNTIRKYDFMAQVDYANLRALNLVKKDSLSVFESKVQMNVNGSNIDNAFGNIVFTNTTYKNEHNTYYFDRFEIASKFDDNSVRFIAVNSPDIINGNVEGRFQFKDLKKLVENSIGNIYANYIPNKVRDDQYIEFNFTIFNKILEVFLPEIEVGPNTFVKGTVESDAKEFELLFKSPQITYKDYYAKDIELQVNNKNPLFNTYVEVDSVSTKFYKVSDFSLINATVNDTLFMRSEFKGGNKNNDIYNLSFYHTINEANESVIGFKKSDVTIKDHTWFINENKDRFNKISFNKSLTKFDIDQLRFNHNSEEIELSGFLRDSTQKDLKLNFKNVDLAKITPDIDSLSLTGNVNGKLNILQKNGSYLPQPSQITIEDLTVNNFLLGSFDAEIKGNEDLSVYSVVATIKDDEQKRFSASGDINVLGRNPSIDVELSFNQFDLAPLNPLLKEVLTNIRGKASGTANIIGDLKEPDILGSLTLDNAGLGIPYLNVDYEFKNNSIVNLNKQSFFFNNLEMTDTRYNSKATLNGSLSHTNLSDWILNLSIETPRLLVLDTRENDESLYYGTGFVGGSATIIGPTEQLQISVVGETKEGTVFKIPIRDTESFGDNTYIKFVTKEQKEARRNGQEVVFNDIEGLELSFDLDVTEDAEVEIIIDKSTGHSLKGRGRGGLLVEINTNGKFNMWGDFSVFEGVYNFAYGGLVQKEFIVQPGGTIAWEGEPLQANINMLAIYKTQANPSPLLDNPINRSIPVELNINIVGELDHLDPDFSFEFPNVNSTVKSELQYRLESRDDRQNQGLYLLSTGSFSRGLNELNFSGTIAERLNGIINGIFSTGDNKINLGLNYEAGQNRPDYRTNDRVGVTLQTQISDRVLINGKVGVPVGGADAAETVIAGDVQIDFLLNEEGTLTANVFNRENSIRNFGEAIGYTQGVGISYQVDFDTFSELIRKLFNISKSKREENKVQQNTSSQSHVNSENSVLPDYLIMKTTISKE